MKTVQQCRSCKANVVWLRKPHGDERMIIDASPEAIRRAENEERWQSGRDDLMPHHATCKDAAKWRKKK